MKKIDGVKHELHPMSLMALILSFMSLAIVTSLIFIPQTDDVYRLFLGIDTFICLMFWSQLLTDLCRSKQKINYLKTHWLDFIASIPIIEPVRYIRVLQIFRVLRLIRSSQQVLAHIRSNRREATVATIFLLITVLVTVGSALILILEGSDPNANIHSATDAVWWVFVTISTVGYGDHYPVTISGKLLAAVIIICGVGLFGMVAGLVSSVITGPQKQKETNEKKRKKEWQQMLESQTRLIERLENLESRLNNNTSLEHLEKHKK
ncbi:capsular biosynthesis protein [Photobacterium profundum]|uniref:Hypothetical potassium channel protein n=1 Tax=Photobacterium profundum 3TCK TaxID=314280 RepID=Q1Z4U2_9GAMM|nr:potassium channel family protein [Photobacterium profundum]EAS43529.1 hypothetical potassium channel protein [Photobacterium profundum 3TCK]PSV60227.1 capsular biosynthesis protein [Photobacterium profundum]